MEYGSIIAAGINAVNGLQNTLIGNAQAKKMWKMQAEYNSPVQQMARYRAAGVNPNLVASQGNPGNMSSAPDLSSNYFPETADKAFNNWLAEKMTKKDLANKDASIRYTNALAQNQENQALLFDTQRKLLETRYLSELFKYNDFLPTQSAIFRKKLEQLGLHNDVTRYNLDYMYPAQLANLNARTNNLKYQTNAVLPSVVQLNKGKLREIGSRLKYILPATSRYLNSNADLKSKTADHFETLILTPTSLDNRYKQMRNFGYENYQLPMMKSQLWKSRFNNVIAIPNIIKSYQQQNLDNFLKVADFVL